ncbi:MAG: hypothetical protein M3198_14445 [Actinomycetota bacterium]|nr:hypothetical protein [Actinomycetota bacterium]
MADVKLPGNAIDPQGADIVGPVVAVLRELQVLPTEGDLATAGKPSAFFGGPPQSVAVIEAGATALSKWWAAGLGTAAIAGWAYVVNFWNDISGASQRTLMLAVAITSAALILSIGFIVGSDVRGRAAGTVATIEARSGIARTVMHLAQGRDEEETVSPPTITALQPRSVKYLTRSGDDESGWVAIALRAKADGTDRKYLIVKGNIDAWASPAELQFIT